jgi:integrase
MTFGDLWTKFEAHELALPERRPSTIADYKAMGKLYLVPHLGRKLLAEIDVETVEHMKAALLTAPGRKAAKGSGRTLSNRSVAKIMTLGGMVWRYGRRIKVARENPFADVRKPKAVKRSVYVLDTDEIGRLRAALVVPWERLLVELAITTGIRSGEVRGLRWDSIDLEGKRLFVERAASRRRDDDRTKTENALRTVPLPAYLVPELKRWKLACPITAAGLVFPGEPNDKGERGAIDADKLLRHVLRRALAKAGLPPLRFHDLRHLAGSFMHEAGVPLKRAQELLGHASERTTLAIYTHTLRRKHDDSADKIAALAGLAGNNRETTDDEASEQARVSA